MKFIVVTSSGNCDGQRAATRARRIPTSLLRLWRADTALRIVGRRLIEWLRRDHRLHWAEWIGAEAQSCAAWRLSTNVCHCDPSLLKSALSPCAGFVRQVNLRTL